LKNIETLDSISDFYKKIQVQLQMYVASNYTARIRANSRTKQLVKKTRVAALYKKLDTKLLSPLEFVERFYDYSYEEFIMESYTESTDLGPEIIEDLLISSPASRKKFSSLTLNFLK
jgi:hypothetical protein